MGRLGTVESLFRYPVKSMLGEELEEAQLGRDGLPGDRAWGVRDERRGDFFVGKRSAALMDCAAWYPESPRSPDEGAVPRIRLPSGESFDADALVERAEQYVGEHLSVFEAALSSAGGT